MRSLEKRTHYQEILEFLYKHPTYYTSFERKGIQSYAFHDKEENFYLDVLREIYDELGLIPDEKNIYITFQNLIQELFGTEEKNIIEVGGGVIPRLATRIRMHQQKGTITVYDPRLAKDIRGDERLILKREKFTDKTPIKRADLLIGLMPCEGAEPLIDQALKHKIDFVLWFCEGGPHGDYFDYFESEEEWLSSTLYYARNGVENKGMGKLMVKHLEPYPNYPIIYNQREK